MISHIYDNLLRRLKMPLATRRAGGLVGTEHKRGRWPLWLGVEERTTLKRARCHEAAHVYFRRPSGTNRATIPQAYVFDNTRGQWSHEKLTELQWKLWNSQEVPLCFIFNRDTIEILSCWSGPQFFNKLDGRRSYHPNEVIALAADIQDELDRFSGEALETGSFWDDPRNAVLADHKRAAHDSLVQAVSDLDAELAAKRILPGPLRRKVLVTCLMLKYLEDRAVLGKADFREYRRGATELFEVLESAGAFVRLLEAQARRFNGDVFQYSPEEKQLLRQRSEDLGRFAGVLDGRTSNHQRHLWKLYSFEHLPVEVISYIYQRFVKGAVGAVYTPPFLVDFLLSEAMPYENLLSGKPYRVLDPACGSGVFLVGAFKRLVNAWRHRSHWRRPDETQLKENLKRLLQQVHGVDMDPVAVELTMFSLSLALCDQLQPRQIRRRFRFDTLRGVTIHERDFFEFLSEAETRGERWDLLVGNPPFKTSRFTPAALAIEASVRKTRALPDGKLIETPYHQLAFLFLEQSVRLVSGTGTVCLLLPSTFLYGINSSAFRASVLRRWHVPQVIDFTSVRNLFQDGDTKCCAVFLRNQPPPQQCELLHITLRRTAAVKEGMFFEIDAYDFHRMRYDTALEDSSVWKADLMGGGRVHAIVQRLLKYPNTLGDFVKQREKLGWIFRVGFIEGDTVARKPATHLTGKDFLPTKAFTEQGIDESEIKPLKGTLFKDAANPQQFKPPAILIRLLRTLPLALRHDYLTYRDDIAGIKAPPDKGIELEELYSTLKRLRAIHRFFIYATSSQMFVGIATVPQKYDLDRLPLLSAKELDEPFLSEADTAVINDVVEQFGEFVRLGQKSPLLLRDANNNDYKRFNEQYLSLLNTIYRKFQSNPPLRTASYTCLQFSYGGPPKNPLRVDEPLERALHRLLPRSRASVRIQRILRLYADNTIYLIKPNRLRYWIPSVAVRDADETVAELAAQDELRRSPRHLRR